MGIDSRAMLPLEGLLRNLYVIEYSIKEGGAIVVFLQQALANLNPKDEMPHPI